jgi:hypothetical protein
MGYSVSGTAAGEARLTGQQLGTVRLAGMLTLSCLISQTGQTTVTFAGELDATSADQAHGYVRDAIDARGGQVLLNVAGLSFCDGPWPGRARADEQARRTGRVRRWRGPGGPAGAGGKCEVFGPGLAGPWRAPSNARRAIHENGVVCPGGGSRLAAGDG